MPNPDHRKITLEDLLRLKRAEHPPADFWANFEQELRQKQLTALMEKRPWWQAMPSHWVRRAYLPVGAAAILGLTLVTIRVSSPLQQVQVESSPRASAVTQSRPIPAQPAPIASVAVSSPLLNHHDPATQRMDDRAPVLVGADAASAVAADQSVADMTPVSSETPSARTIAANLARLEQSEPELMNSILGARLSQPIRSQTAGAPVAELASLSAGATTRSRLLANYNERQLGPEPTAPEIVRERLSRRLGDADYADRFSRIGLKGDQVSLGFTIKL